MKKFKPSDEPVLFEPSEQVLKPGTLKSFQSIFIFQDPHLNFRLTFVFLNFSLGKCLKTALPEIFPPPAQNKNTYTEIINQTLGSLNRRFHFETIMGPKKFYGQTFFEKIGYPKFGVSGALSSAVRLVMKCWCPVENCRSGVIMASDDRQNRKICQKKQCKN